MKGVTRLYRLFDSRLSGNAWKVRILLRQLGLPFERVTLDLAKAATADPAFRAKSRFGRVPVLELDDGRTMVEFECDSALSRRRIALSAG